MARAIVGNLGGTVSKTTQYFTDLPKIAAPFTTVVNRAQVTNFAADGLPKAGVDRIIVQQLAEVFGEQGPNGERVFKAVNDVHDAVRFVGNWVSNINTYGQYLNGPVAGDFVEITFYGTGLNLIASLNSGGYDWRVSVDGGSEGANIVPSTASNVLGARNYSLNNVISVAANLTLGVHTVKLRVNDTDGFPFYGYEVINSSSLIQLPAAQSYLGSRSLTQSSTSTAAYNSGFESGTLGTRGGHVLVYQKSDGTIAKAVTPTDATPKGLGFSGTNSNGTWTGGQADHTNEEEVRRFHWREFGAGRTDDLSSSVAASGNKAFTLDDGTTTLVCSQAGSTGLSPETLGMYASGGFWSITFVGTGLDIVRVDSNTTALDQYTISVDGSSIGTFTGTGNTASRVQKICSGLPYGTHTVRVTRDAFVNAAMVVSQFIVYAPKTPTLPTDAVALADYFVMANYAVNAANGVDTIGTGVLRKLCLREFIYTGSWSIGAFSTNAMGGFSIGSSGADGAYLEYTFFGTGFDFRFTSGSSFSASTNVAVSLQSLSTGGSLQSLTTTNFNTASFATYGVSTSFNSATGALNQATSATLALGAGLSVSNLPLGLYKVRFTDADANGATFLRFNAFDVITPIHAPKEVGPTRIQNVSLIGSCGIRDLRKFSELQIGEQKALCQAVGVANSTLTTPTAYVPATDMSVTIKTKGGPLFLSHSVCLSNSSGPTGVYAQFYVNGVAVGTEKGITVTTATTESVSIADTISIPVPAGVYKIDVYVKNLAGNLNIDATRRNLTVYEI